MSDNYRSRYDPAPVCWEEKSEKLFRVWVGHECLGFPYDKLVDARYFELEQTLSLRWKTGQIAIIGPKAFDFYSAFAEGKATLLKADGKDILSVSLEEDDAEGVDSR